MARPKNLAALTGRPSTFNLAQASRVLERMCAGEALTRIGRDPDMPAATTVLSWAENPRRAWFGAAFRAAQREQARVWSEQRLEIADETVNATAVHQIYSAAQGQRARSLGEGARSGDLGRSAARRFWRKSFGHVLPSPEGPAGRQRSCDRRLGEARGRHGRACRLRGRRPETRSIPSLLHHRARRGNALG